MKKSLCVLIVSIALISSYLLVRDKEEVVSFQDNIILSSNDISDNWSSSKTFTVKNTSSSDYKINIVLKDLVNTFVTDSLVYKITSSNGYNMSEFKVVPKSSSALDEVLAYNIRVSADSEQSYTVTFKYDTDFGYDLSNDDGKMFSGSIQVSNTPVNTEQTLYAQLLEDKTSRSVTTRPGGFSSVYTDDNTKTLYTSTEDGTTVYYFAGNALDNWVKFGKYKTDLIVYRGYHSSNSSYFKDYQTLEACKSASSYNASCTLYKYASAGDDIYWRIIRTNEDGSIRMLYHGTKPTATNAYISTSLFNSLSDNSKYVGYMYDSNGTNSIIKNTIDTWYQNNLTNYTKYLSTTAIYCNDRSGDGSHFGAYQRLITNKMPTYDCKYINDNFTVDSSKGNGKLTYPIALMTADEVSFAGGVEGLDAPAYYYINSLSTSTSSTGRMEWWTMSPSFWGGSPSSVFHVYSYLYPGMLSFYYVDNAYAVRPVISLKSCVKWKSGDGTPDNPYEIVETTSGC